jgi:hypothetical protein
MSDQKQPNGQLQIELTPEVAGGTYSNLAIISHGKTEMVLDFVSVMPGLPKANVKSRIVMNPEHAKRLLFALQDNIIKYEKTFGPIELAAPQEVPAQAGKTANPFGV